MLSLDPLPQTEGDGHTESQQVEYYTQHLCVGVGVWVCVCVCVCVCGREVGEISTL